MAKKTDMTKEQGPIWVAANGLIWSEKPTLDAEEVLRLRDNYYWAGVRHNLANLIYRERYTLEALDADLNPDEDVTTEMQIMCDRPEVDLWTKACMVFPDWFDWGLSPLNPVWGYEGRTWTLQKLRRLPPELFATAPFASGRYQYGEILKGITLSDAGEIEYWITDPVTRVPSQIENVFLCRDPTVPELTGKPMIRPVVSPIRMLDFAWGAQMQKVNRIGAPTIAIEMEKWTADDIAYAQKVAANWGKDTAYVPRPGMKIAPLNFSDSKSAIETIETLSGMVVDFFASSKFISKEGTLIGGSAGPELDITYAFISGIHRKIESNFERLLQPYLDVNGYDGYSIKVHIPTPSADRSELNLKIATELRASGLADPVQYLALLGQEGYSIEEIEGFAAWNKDHTAAAQPAAFGFMNASQPADAFDHHAAIAARTSLKMDAVLKDFKKGILKEIGGDA